MRDGFVGTDDGNDGVGTRRTPRTIAGVKP